MQARRQSLSPIYDLSEAPVLEILGPKVKLKPPQYEPNPKFGTVFTPYFLRLKLKRGQTSNFKAEILPMGSLELNPGTSALHYGQSIFEGMKAFRQPDGTVALFRADQHAKRFRASANKMVMAEVPEEIFVECIKAYVNASQDSVPREAGHSLYLRPLLFAADQIIKVGTSETYEFLVMSTIAGGYFQSGQKSQSAKVMVNRSYVRAYPGGTGEAKAAGNYAASIRPQYEASKVGCDQVLYLDAVEHEYIDELGGMNFFAVRGKELITPQLNGCILHGVTRRSILELAGDLGLNPVEKRLSITELVRDIKAGQVTELFACGTAAVVSPIGSLYYQAQAGGEHEWITLKEPFTTTEKIRHHLTQIQWGHTKAPSGWLLKV